MNVSAQIASSTHSAGIARKPTKTIKLKTFLNSKVPRSPSQRTSLQQLQPSAKDDTQLVGKDGFVRSVTQKPRTPKRKRDGDGENPAKRQAKFITKPAKKFSIYKDAKEEGLASTEGGVTQKTPEEEAYELMVQDEIPEKYWEVLAEERRVALDNTLQENEKLHIEVYDLKEENQRLKVTADQAVYLAEVVQDLLGEKEDDGADDEVERNGRLSEDEEDEVNAGSDEDIANSAVEENSDNDIDRESRSMSDHERPKDDADSVDDGSERNDCR